jgi:hypothetical protein
MSQPPREADAPTMLLRLSVPAASVFRGVAIDLAMKVAEYLSRDGNESKPTSGQTAQTRQAGAAIDALFAEVVPREEAGAYITFEFHQIEGELRIEASCAGRSSQMRHPLPT